MFYWKIMGKVWTKKLLLQYPSTLFFSEYLKCAYVCLGIKDMCVNTSKELLALFIVKLPNAQFLRRVRWQAAVIVINKKCFVFAMHHWSELLITWEYFVRLYVIVKYYLQILLQVSTHPWPQYVACFEYSFGKTC